LKKTQPTREVFTTETQSTQRNTGPVPKSSTHVLRVQGDNPGPLRRTNALSKNPSSSRCHPRAVLLRPSPDSAEASSGDFVGYAVATSAMKGHALTSYRRSVWRAYDDGMLHVDLSIRHRMSVELKTMPSEQAALNARIKNVRARMMCERL
jgi:hypothetical protein